MYFLKFSKLLVTDTEVRNLSTTESHLPYKTLKEAQADMIFHAKKFFKKHNSEKRFTKYLTDNDHAKRREVFTIREGERFVYRVDIVSA